MGRTGIYGGSFDPVTVGHVDLVRRASTLFDHLLVAVGHNPSKRYWFDLATRKALMSEVCASIPNVRVVTFEGLLVDACKEHGADLIVRGLRALSDFEIEFRYGLANRDLSGLETVFLLTDPRYIFVSSSIVKEVAERGGDVSRYVDPPVLEAIVKRVASGA